MARVCRPGGRVVISDMLSPSAADRAAFDALHRVIDPSHARCLLDAEMSGLITTHVGAITGRTEPGITYTLLEPGTFLTDAGRSQRAAMAALRAEPDRRAAHGIPASQHRHRHRHRDHGDLRPGHHGKLAEER